jgi:hypothetical protein
MIRHPHTFAACPPAGFDGVFMWDFLKPAWAGTRIEPMDIDAHVERYGAHLLFETKEPDTPIPEGQRIALTALARRPRITVVHCAKRPAQIDGFAVWANGCETELPGDHTTLTEWCRMWMQQQEEYRLAQRMRGRF